MTPSDAASIPGWFWALVFTALVGMLGLFFHLLLGVIRRELSRLDELPAAVRQVDERVTHLDKRVTVVETKVHVRDDILSAIEERDRRRIG